MSTREIIVNHLSGIGRKINSVPKATLAAWSITTILAFGLIASLGFSNDKPNHIQGLDPSLHMIGDANADSESVVHGIVATPSCQGQGSFCMSTEANDPSKALYSAANMIRDKHGKYKVVVSVVRE